MNASAEPHALGGPGDWSAHNRLVYQTLRLLFTIIVRLRVIRPRIRGAEHVPPSGSVLLIANHQSNLDPVLIAWSMPRPLSIPGKKELFAVPGLGLLLRQVGAFPVDRAGVDPGALRRSIQVLRERRVLAAFPERHRTTTGTIGEFQATVAKLAIREDVAVVPVGMAGAGAILPPGKLLPRFGRPVALCFRQPARFTASNPEAAATLMRKEVIAATAAAEALLR